MRAAKRPLSLSDKVTLARKDVGASLINMWLALALLVVTAFIQLPLVWVIATYALIYVFLIVLWSTLNLAGRLLKMRGR